MSDDHRLPGVRLTPGQDDDLIAWLGELEQEHKLMRGATYKEVVRAGLRALGKLSGGTLPAQGSTTQPPLDLGEMRRVVEAAMESVLARSGGVVLGRPGGAVSGEMDEEAFLADFASTFMMDDD